LTSPGAPVHGRAGLELVLGVPAAVEEALLDEIRSVRQGEALAPIDVVVGGVLQRPYLQRRLADTSAGAINVRFSTVGELGVRLSENALAASALRPLPAIAERAYAAEVARESTTYFAPVASTPGFAEAARRVVKELRQEAVSPEDFAAVAPRHCESAAKGEALAEIYARYAARRAEYYNSEDALAAAEATRFDGVALMVYGVWRLSALARKLIGELAGSVPVTVFLPSVDPDVDLAHADLRAWLLAQGAISRELTPSAAGTFIESFQQRLFGGELDAAADDSVVLSSAPDALTETKEAARTCLTWARAGIPFRQMVVSYRQAEIYRPHVEAVFAEAGIPVYLDDGPSLAERPLGRRILALLDLIDSPLRRRDVIGFLSDGRMPKDTRERFGGAPAARWDSVSRRAAVVEGIDQWRRRLTMLRDAERKAAEAEDAPAWLERRVEDCESLLAFVQTLADDLARRPSRASWRESLVYLGGLLTTYVVDAEGVLGYLEALAELDDLLPEVEFARFIEVVRAEVRALKAGDLDEGQQGAFGRRGVNVLDINQLRHLRFRAVAVLGLTERAFPPPPRQDPLLLDHERERLNEAENWTLPLRARGHDTEPLQFALAVHAAREQLLLSTRRAESAGGRPQLPSVFFRLAASALEGRRVRIDEIDSVACVRRVPAGRLGAAAVERSLTLAERDRTLLEAQPQLGRALLERLEPRAARADELRRARWVERVLTPFDGAFDSDEARESLGRALTEGRPLSATGLEAYALCPHKYFLANVLRAWPLDEPERLLRMEAMTRGSLVHDVLERFVRQHAPFDAAAADALREGLAALAEEALDQAEAEGLTGAPLLWKGDRQAILDDLAGWLEHELAEPGAYTDRALEVAFGTTWSGDEKNALTRDEPFELKVGDRMLRLAGRIDRLDHDATRFRVIDYKTGKGPSAKTGLDGGKTLQLPLYLLVGGWLLGLSTSKGEAAYHVVSRRGEFRRITFTGEQLDERRDHLDQVLTRIVDGIATGDFHIEPGQHCRWCDYDALCDVGRRRIIERKVSDERIGSFRALRELE
jgi:ATP-dependent helicase/nuclease subunit B